jgi:hypothetical protein
MEIPLRSRRRHERLRLRAYLLRREAYHSSRPAPASDLDPRFLGVLISTHGAWCSCSMNCANRRRWEGPTLAERRFADRERAMLDEVGLR